jgi:hypothetical protein
LIKLRVVDEGTLRFEVGQPKKISWGTYFRDLMRPSFGGGFENYSGKRAIGHRPECARPEPGCRRFQNSQEANEKAVVIENELKNLGAASWCERYEVPLAFVAADTDPSPTTG